MAEFALVPIFLIAQVTQMLKNEFFQKILFFFPTFYWSLISSFVGNIRHWCVFAITESCSFFFSRFLPESIRLHMLYNKFDKAEATIAKVVKVNKIPFPRNTFEQIKYQGLNDVEELRSAKKSNVFDVFKYPSLRKISFMLFFIWWVQWYGKYGLTNITGK